MADKSGVFDILHPTPVSLKELAAMAVSLEIWRCEINKHRTSDTLKKFWPLCECISLKTMFPDLPSAIAYVIEEYVKKFALSIQNWLEVHYTKVFRFHYKYKTYIFNKFDNFVCDYDGTVHHEKTAKRMMDSDVLCQAEKFKIACTYFFEDDIRHLWPSVCGKMNLNDTRIDFYETTELCYWICCLKNELEKVPTSILGDSVDEKILKSCISNNYRRQPVQYFWERIPSEYRARNAVALYFTTHCKVEYFVRFILPKLEEEQLTEFVNAVGVELMNDLLSHTRHDETFVLSTWSYIRNVMNVSKITDLVVKMLRSEVEGSVDWRIENRLYLCFEILNNLPLDLTKLSIIRTILSNNNNTLVESLKAHQKKWDTFEFLLGILSCVTVEERNIFWQNYWHYLIKRARVKDLGRIVDICFENEDKIAQFKENITIENESVRDACVFLLSERFFDELSGLVNFCYPNAEKARRFKQWLLQSVLVGDSFCLGIEYLGESEEFHEFIDNTYEDADLSTDFKNELMSPSMVQYRLSRRSENEVNQEKIWKIIQNFKKLASG